MKYNFENFDTEFQCDLDKLKVIYNAIDFSHYNKKGKDEINEMYNIHIMQMESAYSWKEKLCTETDEQIESFINTTHESHGIICNMFHMYEESILRKQPQFQK